MPALASLATARAFVDSLDFTRPAILPGPFTPTLTEAGGATPSIATPATGSDAARLGVKTGIEQSFLVGGQIVSFNAAVTPALRAAALQSCLAGQLQATKLHGLPSTAAEAFEWHAAFVNTMINLGWVLESGITSREATGTQGLSVDKVLIQIVELLLGDVGTAAALAKNVLDAIDKARSDDPFITLYNSRVIQQDLLDFGAALGQADANGFFVSIIACAIEITSQQQQVLFFKWGSDSADVDGRRFDLALTESVYDGIQQQLEQKLLPHVRAFVSSLDFGS